MNSIRRFVAVLAMACVALTLAGIHSPAQDDKPQPKKLPPLADMKWDLKALSEQPFKVIRSEIDDNRGVAYWVIELQRDLDTYESHGWWGPAYKDGKKTRFRFEFHNADGVAEKTLDGFYLGEFVERKGKRFGVALAVPPELRYSKSVEALGK